MTDDLRAKLQEQLTSLTTRQMEEEQALPLSAYQQVTLRTMRELEAAFYDLLPDAGIAFALPFRLITVMEKMHRAMLDMIERGTVLREHPDGPHAGRAMVISALLNHIQQYGIGPKDAAKRLPPEVLEKLNINDADYRRAVAQSNLQEGQVWLRCLEAIDAVAARDDPTIH